MRCKKLALRVLSTAAFLSIVTSCAAPAFADAYGIAMYGNYDLANGSITVEYKDGGYYVSQEGTSADGSVAEDDGQVTISGGSAEVPTSNTITIINNADGSKAYTKDDRQSDDPRDTSAKITLDNVNIDTTKDTSEGGKAGMTVEGSGDVTIEIGNQNPGVNRITSGGSHAGIEKTGEGTLVFRDDNNLSNGYLEVTGGAGAAGIGSAAGKDVSNIFIDNGQITAKGGDGETGGGAGIGSGAGGKAENITIRNGTFNDVSGGKGTGTGEGANGGAGIGSGANGENKNLTIGNGTFNSVTGGAGKNGGAGMGSGGNGTNTSTTVENGTFNSVVGGSGTGDNANGGAGIGSGGGAANKSTTVNNGTYNNGSSVTGGEGKNGGAGIGSGGSSSESNVFINGTANGTGAGGGAGIGSGANGTDTTVRIDGAGTVTGSGSDGAAGIGGGRMDTDTSAGNNTITIKGWSIDVTGKGGKGGAGIGSGKSGNSSEITIAGEDPRGDRSPDLGVDVKGIGGSGAAGIGGGEGGKGGKITLNGGRVTAEGGEGAYAIGSGKGASGSDVAIEGNVNVDWGALDVTAIAKTTTAKAGSIIEGGETLAHEALGNIKRTIVRFCNNSGWFKTLHNEKYADYYAQKNEGIEHTEGEDHLWQVDRKEPTVTENGYIHHWCAIDHCEDRTEILPRLGESEEMNAVQKNKAAWLYVATPDRKATSYDAAYTGSTVTYQKGLDDAMLTGNLAALQQLYDSGIRTVVFATSQCTSSFHVDDLLACGGEDAVFELSHTGSSAALTVGETRTDALLF